MQKWEYCRAASDLKKFYITFYKSPHAEVIHITKDKTKDDKEDGDAFRRHIANLGLEGWELVGVSNEGTIQYLYFKRLLESPS